MGFRSGTIPSAGIGSRNKKPRRVTGLSVMVGPQGHSIQTPPVHVRGDTFFVTNRDIQMVKVGINYRFNWSGYGYGYGYGY